ncbi:MAG: hypothetical protein AUI36_42430 [Cyanobacteria bacterium 13_1_40CM_2_61_4]|nr:MAG: hypothetical protein AUI36_42430 [Cyanobacteria bacterium 13_1_40CM_2_61_4]
MNICVVGRAQHKGAWFLIASTFKIDDHALIDPQRPIGPRGVYAEATRFGDAMTTADRRYHSVDTRIARIFN